MLNSRGRADKSHTMLLAKQLRHLFTSILLVFPVVVSGADDLRRTDFPHTFIFGAGSSAYQVEGAAFEDGRRASIWDTFAHAGTYGGANADVSCDAYHKYKEDVKLMADTGLEGYRFSISWSRLIPNGRGPVNPKGLQYYNNLINELLSHGIQPHVTLCHSDLPQALQDEYGGWMSRKVMFADPLMFGDYPDIMKRNAGSRLPKFTREESKKIKGTIDFIALNHYQTVHVKDSSSSLESKIRDYTIDGGFEIIYTDEDSPPGQIEYPVNQPGLGDILEYLKQAYGNIPIYIHENGQLTRRNATLNDTSRVEYLQAYIGNLLDAIRNGSNVKGYFTWSFLDCFELFDAYGSAFGLYYVDLDDKDLRRYPKLSAHWYSNFLKGKGSKHTAILPTEQKLLHSSQ